MAFARLVLRGARYRGGIRAFITFALFGSIVLVMWYGARLVEAGALTFGELTQFLLYRRRQRMEVEKAAADAKDASDAKAAAEAEEEAKKAKPKPKPKSKKWWQWPLDQLRKAG